MSDNRHLTVAEQLEGALPDLCFMVSYPVLVEAIALLREAAARIAELEAALREIGSYELNYARQESPLEALLALQRYARAALEVKE